LIHLYARNVISYANSLYGPKTTINLWYKFPLMRRAIIIPTHDTFMVEYPECIIEATK
jgi:hypothetical protein